MENIISKKVWSLLKDTRGIRKYGKKETAYSCYMPIWLAGTISFIVSDGGNGKRGHYVHAITGTPNYPMGEIFEGYEKIE